ncbi:MAG: hypothetical protein RLZ98_1572 [Pseudomonadota bacterium]|jgi:molybdenum cofactor cytidylyltransferase
MKFGRIALSQATGAILAHSHKVAGGTLKKGRILTDDDIARLAAAGMDEIIGAHLDPDDIGEDEAAHRVAMVLAGPGARVAAPFTGRANLFSEHDGVALINAELINRLNTIDEGLTIATVPPFERVRKGQMLATVKVITFALAESVVAKAEQLANESGGNQGHVAATAFQKKSAALIMTKLPGTKTSILEKRRKVMADRLAALGNSLAATVEVSHDTRAVRNAIDELAAKGHDPILVFAASAIVDRGDVIPAAIIEAGGEIVHLGMPVDPGNLLLAGRLGEKDVIGVPSCAGSPKLNGFDWVLERRIAGIPVRSSDIAAMGVGGLLMEIAIRPQARAVGEDEAESRTEPAIAAIVMAAGRSTRMGAQNKLLADVGGKTMVRRVVETVLASRARPVVVVTGHQADIVRNELAELDVSFAHNPDYANGISGSMKTGLAALPRNVDGALIVLGDMPELQPEHLDKMISAFAPKEHRSIIVPTAHGKRGNPILWSADLFNDMRDKASGDKGARALLEEHSEEVVEVELATEAIFDDVDTPELLDALRKRIKSR